MQVEPYRPGWQAPGPLERGTLVVAGVRRVLHGSGMTGRVMARLTGPGVRGMHGGARHRLPGGWKGAWHAARLPDLN